jgi:hypothetical protein
LPSGDSLAWENCAPAAKFLDQDQAHGRQRGRRGQQADEEYSGAHQGFDAGPAKLFDRNGTGLRLLCPWAKRTEKSMPQGDKTSYTGKQRRQARHIEQGYEKKGVSRKTAEARAWATVNKTSGGGKRKRAAS